MFRFLSLLTFGRAAVVTVAVVGCSWWWTSAPGEMVTRNTVRLAMLGYGVALGIRLFLTGDVAGLDSTWAGLVRRWWSWGCVCFWAHLAAAFHFYHHWSVADAFERTRQISGVGEGIYASALFTLLWSGDVLWAWTDLSGYEQRRGWPLRLMHGFLYLIVFNGMVVFETGFSRWFGSLLAVGLVVCLYRGRCANRDHQQGTSVRMPGPQTIRPRDTAAGSPAIRQDEQFR